MVRCADCGDETCSCQEPIWNVAYFGDDRSDVWNWRDGGPRSAVVARMVGRSSDMLGPIQRMTEPMRRPEAKPLLAATFDRLPFPSASTSAHKSSSPPVATPRSPHTPTLGRWSPEEPELLILGTSQEGLARLLFLVAVPVRSEITARTEPGMSAEQAARIREIAWAGKSGEGSTMPKEREKAEALAAAAFDAAKAAT